MKIVADEEIPWLDDLFAKRGDLIKRPGNAISPNDLKNADLLLVRSVTKINAELLENSNVKMVGSATAGFDHVDVDWLRRRKIHFAYSAGCNANAVSQYVVCCIAKLVQKNLLQTGLKAGVIGVGHVGSQVAQQLTALGFSVLLNDPPRQQQEPNFRSAPLAEFENLDLICVHTSLTSSGPFPSYHLLNQHFLSRLKKNGVIINAGRGEVLDEHAFLKMNTVNLCSDVWANEPNINYAVVDRSLIATPHIGGYSLQAKFRATAQIYEAAREFFSWPESHFTPTFHRQLLQGSTWEEIVLHILEPEALRIKKEKFSENRKHYTFRNEFEFCDVLVNHLPEHDQEILQQLGFHFFTTPEKFQKPE